MTNHTLQNHIIFEDANILVLNKPSGCVVNRSHTAEEGTVQHFLLNYLKIPLNESTPFNQRTGLAHRLDRDTSGVLLVGKTEEYFNYLLALFKNREISKEYIALVYGKLAQDVIEINAPIGRNPNNRFKFAITSEGKEASTRIEKIKEISYNSHTLTVVKAYPKTGRTHQIRVHLAALGTAVIGDLMYLSTQKRIALSEDFPRLMLHAYSVSWNSSIYKTPNSFQAPLPKLFSDALE
ncbi:MAG: RluA family pseudouridine synthase [Patescibacteria group bacterium]